MQTSALTQHITLSSQTEIIKDALAFLKAKSPSNYSRIKDVRVACTRNCRRSKNSKSQLTGKHAVTVTILGIPGCVATVSPYRVISIVRNHL